MHQVEDLGDQAWRGADCGFRPHGVRGPIEVDDLCACFGCNDDAGSGCYVFLSPDGGHYRRSNYARRIFRPACDGRYDASKLVIANATVWPGVPIARWPLAVTGHPFLPPGGKGIDRLVSSDETGHCPSCGHAVTLRLDGSTVAHKTGVGHCPGSGKLPAADVPLACWLPVRDGLTPHGVRHSHKTWMAEDGIPEILAEQRLGHEIPVMRGLYAHVSQRMRDELTAALQARWEESLRERAAIVPHSPVPLLDGLLASQRKATPLLPRDPREVDLPNSSQDDGNPIP